MCISHFWDLQLDIHAIVAVCVRKLICIYISSYLCVFMCILLESDIYICMYFHHSIELVVGSLFSFSKSTCIFFNGWMLIKITIILLEKKSSNLDHQYEVDAGGRVGSYG